MPLRRVQGDASPEFDARLCGEDDGGAATAPTRPFG
jgi:hypothetical protein